MTKDMPQTTREASSMQEENVAKALGGYRTANSGAGKFQKCDVIVQRASMGVECKTSMTDKKSVSISRDWLIKNKQECFQQRLSVSALAINFGPSDSSSYYVIDEKLMQYLVEKLSEENS